MSDAELLRGVYPQLRRFAAMIAAQATEPDDLVQEAVARVLRLGSLDDLDEPVAYLRTTMLNIVRNEHRRSGRERDAIVRLAGDDADRDGGGQSGDRDEGIVDLSVLDLLSPDAKAAVYLIDVEGFSTAEAAALIGISNTAVRARVSRARRFLRSQLTKETGA